MSKVRTAAVIGGGIAGPVAALALARAGIQPTIFERRREGAYGGTIALAPNGVAALGIVGAADAVEAAAEPISAQRMTIGGRSVALPELPGAGPLRLVKRTDLARILHDRVREEGITVAYGKRLIDVQGSGVVFEDGDTTDADVIVGADGIHSTVRSLIDPSAPGPRYTGMIAVEGLAELPVESGTMTFAFGRNAYYLYSPAPGGGTMWGVNLPSPTADTFADAQRVPVEQWRSRLLETYGDDDPGGALIRSTPADRLFATGALYLMPPVPRWHRDRMVLVGDAVHAPSNSSGQGASLAIESAIQLARCLRDLRDPASAFRAYEGMRRSRVEGITARAAKINHTKAPGPIGRRIMPLLMPLALKAMNPEHTMGREQRYRIDWNAPV